MSEQDSVWSRMGLTNNQLKILAMIAMFMDHFGKQICPDVMILQLLGRLAFPIFAYMIAEGCRYTRSRVRYLSLLFGLGALCQLVYFVALGDLYQNILLTFSMSVSLIFSIDAFIKKRSVWRVTIALCVIAFVLFVCVPLPVMLKDRGFDIDYGLFGVLLPVAVYFMPNKPAKLCAAAVMILPIVWGTPPYKWFSFAALLPLALYNGKRGKYKLKYLFYIFYPVHLVLIFALSLLLQ